MSKKNKNKNKPLAVGQAVTTPATELAPPLAVGQAVTMPAAELAPGSTVVQPSPAELATELTDMLHQTFESLEAPPAGGTTSTEAAMIENASLLRIDRRTGVNAANEETFTPGSAIAAGAVRGMTDAITNSQRWTLGSTVEDADRVFFLEKSALANGAPAESDAGMSMGDRLLVATDGEIAAGELCQIVAIRLHVLNDLDHWEIFLKKV